MSNLIGAILQKSEDDAFVERLLDLVVQTGHDKIGADHLLAAWLGDGEAQPSRALARQGWDPAALSTLIAENIPTAETPELPPSILAAETLEPAFLQRCRDAELPELGQALVDTLSPAVVSMLQVGAALEPLQTAFSLAEAAPVSERPAPLRFFNGEGTVNRAVFTANALALVAAVEKTAAELGYARISLSQLFVGMVSEGVLRDYVAGFGVARLAALAELRRHLSKGHPVEAASFREDALSASVKRYVQRVEEKQVRTEAPAFDEILLASTLCEEASELLDSYWRSLQLDKHQAASLIATLKDDSPLNPPMETGLPDFDEMVEVLANRIIGQDEPIRQIMPVVRKWSLGFQFDDRPVGVLLFMGPSGVGKTELSKELARILYGDRKKLCFIEMNQMTEAHTVSMLIGSPPGFKGPDSGKLTDWIAQHPESIILFDEVEKAHEVCFDILLRLLSEGRVQDACGREYDATGNLIIMTSNIGQGQGLFESVCAQRQQDQGGEPNALNDPAIRNLLRYHFRPEFIGRLTNVILFNPLEQMDYLRIARIITDEMVAKMKEKGIAVEVKPEIYAYLAQEAGEREQGARALKALVDTELTNQVIQHVVAHKDADALTLTCDGGEIVIMG